MRGIDTQLVMLVSAFFSNPEKGKFSISLWLKVVSPQAGYQTVFATGTPTWNTGVLFRVLDYAKRIIGRLITSAGHLLIPAETDLPDTLATWSHIAVANDYTGKAN